MAGRGDVDAENRLSAIRALAAARVSSPATAAPARAPVGDPCLICGSVDHDVLYPATYRGTLAEAADYFLAHRSATAHGTIVRCRHCRFVFTSPRFSPADYDRIYAGICAPNSLPPGFAAAQAARFRRLAAIVRRHVPGGGDFVDFGCGDGGFLEAMNDPRGRGFEVGADGFRRAGPSQVVSGDWARFAGSPACPPASLDVVTAFDVFEHLAALDEAVALIRTVLKPGGLLFASVPDISSVIARTMGKRWNMLLLEHLWYFSPATLERFLARHGFEQIEVRMVPYDAPLAHIATRISQTFGLRGRVAIGPLSQWVLPTPAGIMLGVYRAR